MPKNWKAADPTLQKKQSVQILIKLDEIIADKRINEIRSGKTKLYSLEEVTKKLDLC